MTKCQTIHVQSADDCIKAAAHDILSLIRAVIRNDVCMGRMKMSLEMLGNTDIYLADKISP